jgi:hypothetical protein
VGSPNQFGVKPPNSMGFLMHHWSYLNVQIDIDLRIRLIINWTTYSHKKPPKKAPVFGPNVPVLHATSPASLHINYTVITIV